LQKPPLYYANNSQLFYAAGLEDKEQLSFRNQVQIQKIIGMKNPGSRTVSKLELNLFEVQTCFEKIL
jgi:hypothetical protein